MTRAAAGALVVLAAGLLLAAPAAQAAGRVPRGFVGAMIDGPMTAAGFDLDAESGVMVASGVESVRTAFHWGAAQPYPNFAAVPPADRASFRDVGGVPTSFAHYDRLVASAARRRLRLLPVLTTAAYWAAKYPGVFASPPSGTASYARFAAAVVGRYGPRGSFWRENPSIPRMPIRSWQIWNEPNLRASWRDRDYAPGYVALLRAARRAIRRADPGARIVLAGLANQSWRSLARIYRQPGARRLFDVVAIHPYTRQPKGVIAILELARRTMRRYRDARKPLLVTEFGWPSSLGRAPSLGFETTERGQASRLGRVLPLLARHRRGLRLRGAYLYTWLGSESRGFTFTYSGIRRLDGSGRVVSKPAHAAFRRAALRLEHCARKSSVATRCARRAR